MRLAAILSIQAGGAGSGCRGPNCGRPRTAPTTHTVPTRYVKQSWVGSNGERVTILQAPRRGRPKGSLGKAKNLTQKESPLKGQFKLQYEVKTHDGQGKVAVYSANKKDNQPGDTRYKEGAGRTLFVNRSVGTGRMIVHDFKHGEHGAIERADVMTFKNFGRGASVLKKRYDLTQKLPKR